MDENKKQYGNDAINEDWFEAISKGDDQAFTELRGRGGFASKYIYKN